MRYQFIKGKYRRDGQLLVHARSEENKRRKILIKGIDPYFYVAQNKYCNDYHIRKQEVGYEGIYGEHLKKIIVDNPSALTNLQKEYSETWEDDLDVVQRFLIDKGIKSGFTIECPHSHHHENTIEVDAKEIQQIEYTHPPVVCYLGIEVYNKHGKMPDVKKADHPIVAVSIGTNIHEEIFTFFLLDNNSPVEGLNAESDRIRTFTEESMLLKAVQDYLEELRPDLITGWNLEQFDLKYLENRADYFSLDFNHAFSLQLDLKQGWRKMERGGSSLLKDIVIDLGLAKRGTLLPRRYRTDLHRDEKESLLFYNRAHVRCLKQLDAQRGITTFFWDLKNRVGLSDMRSVFYNGNMINLLLLRELKDTVVLPSTPSNRERARRKKIEEQRSIEGGKVLQPEIGLFENVAVLDFSRFYPSLLIANNISPEIQKDTSVYEDGTGVMTKITERLWEERDRYEEKLNKLSVDSERYAVVKKKRDIVKYLLNSTWAYMGWKGARIWNIKSRKEVLEKTREALEYIAEQSEKLGYEVVYGDTDSIFVKTDSLEDAKQATDKLNIKALNIDLQGRVQLDLDKFFTTVMFVPHKQEQRAAQKRYVGRATFKGGEPVDTIEMAGFNRSDNAPITEELRPPLCRKLLEGHEEEAIHLLQRYIEKIRNRDISLPALAIPRSIHKSPKAYEHTTPWVRGIKYSNQHFNTRIKKGDYVKTLYVTRVKDHPPTREVSFLDIRQIPSEKLVLDTKRIVEKTIKMKVKDLLEVAGLSWLRVEGYKKLNEAYI